MGTGRKLGIWWLGWRSKRVKSHEKMQRFLKAVIRRFPLDVSMHRRIKSLKIRKILDILLLIPALIYFIYL